MLMLLSRGINNGTTVLKSKVEISKLRFNMKNTEGHKDSNTIF